MNTNFDRCDHYNYNGELRNKNVKSKRDYCTFFVVMAIVFAVFITGLFIAWQFSPDIEHEIDKGETEDVADKSSYAVNGGSKSRSFITENKIVKN